MIEQINQLLSLVVLMQAGFVVATTGTVVLVYARHERPIKQHVLFMMTSYLCLTFVIAYNVVFDHVTMPPLTAFTALVGFVCGDIGLTRYLLALKLHVS